ncbi:MAG: DUF5615 family PIN-like protein [Isosphaeraceae bacterium]
MAQLYADENFRYPVVEAPRRLGHDVLTAQEAGRGGKVIDDDTVLADADAAGRILLSQNRRDFIRRHHAGLPHRGIVVSTYDPDAAALAQRIDAALAAESGPGRWLRRVNRPPPGTAGNTP